jgi:hypothetical protein
MRKHYVGALVLTTYQPPILVLKVFKKTNGFHERTKILCRRGLLWEQGHGAK